MSVQLRLYGEDENPNDPGYLQNGYSAVSTITNSETIPAPTGLTAVADPLGSQIPSTHYVDLSWNAITPFEDGNIIARNIQIQRSDDGGVNYHTVAMLFHGDALTSFQDIAPNEDTAYFYRIRQQIAVAGVPTPGYRPFPRGRRRRRC